MQKILVLFALVAVAYLAMRMFGSAARPKTVRADKGGGAKNLPATPLRYDEKTGMYVPGDE